MTQDSFGGRSTDSEPEVEAGNARPEPVDEFDADEPFGELVTESSNSEDSGADAQSLSMFEDDASELYPEQRRCLHALLKNRYISAERHPEHWAVLMSNFPLIKSRLNELFLELEVNRSYQVAFKRQATTETGDPLPSLLQDVSHRKEETIVMMYLRRRFFTQQQEGEDYVYVDRVAILEEVADMRPENNTHRAMDRRRADRAIESLAKAGVLHRTGDPDRYRISPIIDVLLPIERQRALWAWLMMQNGTGQDPDADRETDRDSAEIDDSELAFDDEEEVLA